MSDVMAANPQHYSMGGFSYGTLCNATASPVPPSQMGVCELFNQLIPHMTGQFVGRLLCFQRKHWLIVTVYHIAKKIIIFFSSWADFFYAFRYSSMEFSKNEYQFVLFL